MDFFGILVIIFVVISVISSMTKKANLAKKKSGQTGTTQSARPATSTYSGLAEQIRLEREKRLAAQRNNSTTNRPNLMGSQSTNSTSSQERPTSVQQHARPTSYSTSARPTSVRPSNTGRPTLFNANSEEGNSKSTEGRDMQYASELQRRPSSIQQTTNTREKSMAEIHIEDEKSFSLNNPSLKRPAMTNMDNTKYKSLMTQLKNMDDHQHIASLHGKEEKYKTSTGSMGVDYAGEGCEKHQDVRYISDTVLDDEDIELTILQRLVVFGEVINKPLFLD